MILYSTCRACGNIMQITAEDQTAHPTCEPKTPPPPPTKLAAALWYAGLGWPVFPLLAFGEANPRTGEISDGKKPATRHGLKDATTDTAVITRWWVGAPDRNIGLRTGVRFDVIDIDVPEGLTTLEHLRGEDRAVHGWVDTASGGVHLYITPAGRSNFKRRRPGVDYRGDGGYVVAPPSTTDLSAWQWKHLPSPVITGRGDTYGVCSA